MNGNKKFLKVISINLLIFIVLISLFELIFGYWLKDDNFGIFIRDQRNIEKRFDTLHKGEKYNYC